jgi:hypothetical protein
MYGTYVYGASRPDRHRRRKSMVLVLRSHQRGGTPDLSLHQRGELHVTDQWCYDPGTLFKVDVSIES